MMVQLSKGRNGTPLCKSVGSYEEASKAVRAYIERNGKGVMASSRFTGGPISDGGQIVAHVSYNGRVWEGPVWKSGMAPLYDPRWGELTMTHHSPPASPPCYLGFETVRKCPNQCKGECGYKPRPAACLAPERHEATS